MNKTARSSHAGGGPWHRTALFSLAIFVVFFSYYYITSGALPLGAGPDSYASEQIVHFMYKHDRMAVLPEDEDELSFSPYGGTRALRPPLSFAVSALTAKALHPWVADQRILFRKGSSLQAAATVAVVFYTAALYFGSYTMGLFAALLFGLLPQFAFIASYTNDDSGAILTATLVVCVLVRILRQGVNWLNAILLAMAGGLVILSKQTAWLLAPTVLLFLAAYVRVPWQRLLKYVGAGMVVFMLSGGWWIAFNMYHYGADDPFLSKTIDAVAAKHATLPPSITAGYARRGIGYTDLLIGDYDNFWPKTIASTIGNLDWLRLRVGPLQYGLYLALFAIGIIYVLLRLGRQAYGRVRKPGTGMDRDVIFEVLMAFAVLFQFCVYMRQNMNYAVQLQGKYLLPAFLPVVLLGLGGVRRVIARAAPILLDSEPATMRISGRALRTACAMAIPMVLIGIHVDALVGYVLPFYRPTVYTMHLHRGLQDIGIPAHDILLKHQLSTLTMTGDGFRAVTDGVDGWFVVDLSGRRMCNLFRGHNILKARLRSDKKGIFQVYVDRGHGFREKDSIQARYPVGESSMILVFDVPRCSRLRFDPAVRPASVEMSRMSLGKIVVTR